MATESWQWKDPGSSPPHEVLLSMHGDPPATSSITHTHRARTQGWAGPIQARSIGKKHLTASKAQFQEGDRCHLSPLILCNILRDIRMRTPSALEAPFNTP